MSELSLAIIAKDEVEKVKEIIKNYSDYFSFIDIAVDQRIEEFQALSSDKVRIYPYEWIDDFSHKRNFLADKITTKYYFRLDTDDTIDNIAILPELFKRISSDDVDILYVMYDYAKDDEGNVVAQHWRETIIKKRDGLRWAKKIHENILMDNQEACKLRRDTVLKITHHIDEKHAVSSGQRNFKALMDEFERDGERTDPRTIAYIGRMLHGAGRFLEAIKFLQVLVERSGWDHDKYFAWVQISQCYTSMNNMEMAIAACNEALAINTQFPDAFIQMGYIYLKKGDHVKAVDWVMPGIARGVPDTVIVVNPTFYKYEAKLTAAMALLGKGDIKMACQMFTEAKKYNPNGHAIIKYEPMFRDALELDVYVKNMLWIANYVNDKDKMKLSTLVESIPDHAFRDERVWAIRNRFSQPKTYPHKHIAIYCGQSWEDWSPASTIRGIGGSEEAVIYVSRELARLGYEVTVFNQCGEMKGNYEGVEYKPYHAFNPKDNYNILIGWRRNSFRGISAKQKIVWLHDVPYDGMFLKDSVDDFDKMIVLSEFHKSLVPDFIPRDKIFVSSNGVNLKDFEVSGIGRDSKRMIYTSSYDRGLEHLLLMWADIKKEVPEANLHIFYGWNTYDEMVQKGARDGRFKKIMLPLMNQEGVFEHGRVGHKKLAKEFLSSGLWVYPSHFEEISCISAMKAQVAGCVPVCTDYAALKETVKIGVLINGKGGDSDGNKKYKESLIEILKNDERQEEIRIQLDSLKESFGWGRVALSWHESLFYGNLVTA